MTSPWQTVVQIVLLILTKNQNILEYFNKDLLETTICSRDFIPFKVTGILGASAELHVLVKLLAEKRRGKGQ